MRISFNRNGFIALASMLSFAVYAGDNLPLATAASGTNGSIQVSEHGVDTSNEFTAMYPDAPENACRYRIHARVIPQG